MSITVNSGGPSTWSSNIASDMGGLFYIYSTQSITMSINQSTLSQNRAGNFGGLIYGSTNGQFTLTQTQVTASTNVAGKSGGLVALNDLTTCSSKITVTTNTLTSNSATTIHGGLFYQVCPNTNELEIQTSIINGAQAGVNGGLGYFLGTTNKITLTDTQITSTVAGTNGGAFYCEISGTSTI